MYKNHPAANRIIKFVTGVISCIALLVVTEETRSQDMERHVKPNYNQAERYSSRYLRQFVYDSSVTPRWIGESDKFWYSYRTSNGTRYYLVDPKHATKEDLFDHSKMAAKLSELIRRPLDSARLPLSRVEIEDDGSAIKFVVDKFQYQYDLEDEELVKLGKAPTRTATSRFGRGQGQVVEEKKEEKKEVEKKEDVKKEDVKKEDVKKEDSGKKEKGDTKKDEKKESEETEKQKQDGDSKKDEGSKKDDRKQDDEKEEDQSDKKGDEKSKSSEKTKSNVDKSSQEQSTKKDGENKEDVKKDEDVKEKKDQEDGGSKKDSDKEKEKKEQTDHRSFSPDRTAYVFAKGYDLYLVEIPEGYEYKPESKEESENESGKDENKDEESDKDSDSEKSDDESEQETDDSKKDNGVEKGDKDQSKESDKDDKKDTDKKEKKDEKQEKTKDAKDSKAAEDGDEDEEKELPIPDIGPELDDTAIRLSDDGAEKFTFARRSRRRSSSQSRTEQTEKQKEEAKNRKSRPSVSWSKDSKAFFVSRRDSRNVKELFVINSLSNPRPTLETYSYSMPGEEEVSISHFYYVNRDDQKLVEVEKKWKNETIRSAHWKRDGHQLRFIRSDRLLRNIEFCELDPASGDTKCLIEEGFEAANISARSVRYLKETDEMIWVSERSGWSHFYLYDLDGNLKNSITSGEFRASRIVDIDEENRLVYFNGNGREEGENIYQNHLYCVRLDGTGLVLMDPGNANHRSTLSPSKRYLVDNCSRVDMAPVSILRDAQGKEIMQLESSDMSRLTEVGWKMPSTFVVKAADGVTDLYGNIWRPFDFDPNKKYPIIAHVYPGPQTEGTSHTFSATSGNQQLAQLGFVVIQVGHRGGTPQRSKAYHSYGYFNLRDYGLADKKAAIEQLAQRFPWVDVERVGIYGHSGGGFMTAAALLREPYNDFFKVGVSTAGNHDNNIYNSAWSERYHGLKRVVVDEKESGRSGQQRSGSRTQRGSSTRSSAPDAVSDYSAFSSEESDFFYENEGTLNADGDLEFSVEDELADGPRAFRQDTDKTDDKKSDEKKKSDMVGKDSTESDDSKEKQGEKSDQKKKSKKDEKDKIRFEIQVPTNAELAANLKGHLFLIHGEADNNVHPANTLRLVDALIKANKRFDMLYLPATRHGFGSYQPYVTQRMYEYFAEHLLDDYQSDADLGVRE